MTGVYRLVNPVRSYDWGSRTALGELLGRPSPDGGPEAELWLGAHPGAASLLMDAAGGRTRLDEAIAADPRRLLGPAGAELPFLLKVLAVEHPLSLQVHPDRPTAAAGFAAQERSGPALDDDTRTFRDANHKPELVCALTPFDALCGFRPHAEIVALLTDLAVPALAAAVGALARGGGADALRDLVEVILRSPPELTTNILDRARGHLPNSPWAPSYRGALDLGGRFPGDPGVAVSLLLNRVHLRPGEAMYTPPGRLHAYLHGVAIELMASSDNVVRAGLSSKHVDLDLFLGMTEFTGAPVDVVRGRPDGHGWVRYPVPVPDFALATARLSGGAVASQHAGPQVLMCLEGGLDVQDDTGALHLARGDALFAAAGSRLSVRGVGRLVRATTADPA